MAKCKYCGKDAGFLSSEHKECARLAKQSMSYFTDLALHVLRHGGNKEEVMQALEAAATNANLTPAQREKAALEAIGSSVNAILDDGIVTPTEEKNLLTLVNAVGLPIEKIQTLPLWDQVVKSLVLSDILNGQAPVRCSSPAGLGIVLQKGETVIWIFNQVKHHELRTKRHFVGGSAGVSVRVCKGVYLRTSAFKGKPVETSEMVHAGTGSLILTTKHVFFQGPGSVVKVPAKKIISVEPFTDGILLHTDGASAKPRAFQNLDGLFAYNVMTNLNLL